MTELMKREQKPVDLFGRFDRKFAEWKRSFASGRSLLSEQHSMTGELIRVDEYRENGDLVIRAELPGIDPDKDVELTVSDGKLHIAAERHEEEKVEEEGYLRHELRCGCFSRTLPLPEGVTEGDVKASYKDGILEIRIPAPEPKTEPAKKIEIAQS